MCDQLVRVFGGRYRGVGCILGKGDACDAGRSVDVGLWRLGWTDEGSWNFVTSAAQVS
jgi:hypothetical protein